jgi:homoaconitase/3-isopropylmalate dehydratase large subunit
MNYTIMHTEFVRERAEPSMLIPGSDSHTCPAGAVGCLSTGLGTADVTMALSTGETWRLPIVNGKKHYVPNSLPVLERLRELSPLEVYEEAGFTRGPPGCSYGVGMLAEKAAEGEIWLSRF